MDNETNSSGSTESAERLVCGGGVLTGWCLKPNLDQCFELKFSQNRVDWNEVGNKGK